MNDTKTAPPQTPELVRLHGDRMVAGVASGLGRRFDVGVGWVRLAFIVTSFFGGLGVLLYVIGWLVIRDETQPTSLAEQWIGDLQGAGAWIGIGLMVLAAMVVLGATGIVRGELVFAAGLFVAGVLLYRGQLPGAPRRPTPEASSAPAVAGTASAPGSDERWQGAAVAATSEATVATAMVEAPAGGPPPAPPVVPSPAPPSPPRPPAPPRPRSYLGRFTVAASLILVGVIALLDNLDVIDPALRHYVAGVVLVIGSGLLIGSVFGRARGLIALGLLAMPFLLVVSAVRTPFAGEWGDRSFAPIAVNELQTDYELSGGSLRLDLRNIDDIGAGAGLTADVGFGELVVYVASDAPYEVNITADVGIGELNLAGDQRGGFGLDDAIAIGDVAGPAFDLDLEVGIGSLRVITTP